MKRNTKITVVVASAAALAAILLFRSCGKTSVADKTEEIKDPEKTVLLPFIRPVSAAVDVPFTEYTVIAGRDTQLTFPSGSKLSIPSCAFSKEGKMLSNQQVTLRYREFHSKAELVASGIPMTMSGNSNEFLETTGMMELRAYHGQDTLSVSAGCGIKVELANTEAGEKVNLYQLDESERAWVEKSKELPAKVYSTEVTVAKKVKVKKKGTVKTEKEALKAGYFKPVKPRVANPKKYSFHFKINLQQYPELNVYDGILWEYAGKGGSDDPGQNKWVQTAAWREMVLRPTSREEVYEMTLSTREKSFTTLVRPVFEKEDMEYARDIFKDRYSKYRKYMDKKNSEDAAWEVKEAKMKKAELVTRTFEINQFGVWNCDRYMTLPDPMVVAMKFTPPSPGLMIERVYVIEKNINSVIQVSALNNVLQTINLKKGGEYELLLLDSEARFRKISKQEFSDLLVKGTNLTIPVSAESVEIKSSYDLKKLM